MSPEGEVQKQQFGGNFRALASKHSAGESWVSKPENCWPRVLLRATAKKAEMVGDLQHLSGDGGGSQTSWLVSPETDNRGRTGSEEEPRWEPSIPVRMGGGQHELELHHEGAIGELPVLQAVELIGDVTPAHIHLWGQSTGGDPQAHSTNPGRSETQHGWPGRSSQMQTGLS